MSSGEKIIDRRTIIAGLGMAGLAGAAASSARPSAAAAPGEAAAAPRWRPSLEPQDDWLELPGRHRFVFDATTPQGVGAAVNYANNFFIANQSGYGLKASDLAVVIVLRHTATPFAFTDEVWALYGDIIGPFLKIEAPKRPAGGGWVNPRGAAAHEAADRDATFEGLIERGVHFAVCGMAADGMIEEIAAKARVPEADVRAKVLGHLLANSHLAAAGIVAVNRAQERGYALAYAG